MADFDHAPATQPPENVATSTRNARVGLWLFAVYLVFYGAFVGLTAFAPGAMETILAGITLAIWYGFALIAVALVLALVYGWLCRSDVAETPSAGGRR